MSHGGIVTIKADDLVEVANDLDQVSKRLRELGAAGFSSCAKVPTTQLFTQPTTGDVVTWMVKEKATNQSRPANAEDGWAWGFIQERDGSIPPGRAQLVEAVKRLGKVAQAGYEITLSRDGKFLNRVKPREACR
jgi:hypothetical protein